MRSNCSVRRLAARSATAASRASRSAKCRYGAETATPRRRLASAIENAPAPRSPSTSMAVSISASRRSPWWYRPRLADWGAA